MCSVRLHACQQERASQRSQVSAFDDKVELHSSPRSNTLEHPSIVLASAVARAFP